MVERRLIWLAGIVLVWGGAIFGKLVALQVVHHQEYVRKARARQEEVVPLRAQRGPILDRTGHPLAMSVPTESVFVDPRNVPSLEFDSDLLARELHLVPAELYQRLKAAADGHRGFLWVKRGISQQEADDVRNLKLDWIHVDSGSERHYPNAFLAAHVLGGVDFEEKGNGGIEKALDGDLHGTPGLADILTDVHHRGIFELVSTQARAGVSVTLTIDEHLQFVAEREIAAAVKEHEAASGSVVVMNPYDGEILALASYPPYDPNQPPETENDVAARSNHAVSVPFEPGSCFKVITLSAALETTNLRPETPHQLPRRRVDAVRPDHPRFARAASAFFPWPWCWLTPAMSEPSKSACRWGANRCTTTCADSASARRPASRCPANRRAACGR